MDAKEKRALSGEQQTQSTLIVNQLYNESQQHPASGMTGRRLAELLRRTDTQDFSLLVDLAEDMEEKDAHLAAELGKRRRSILTLAWDVLPPKNPSKNELLAAHGIKELLLDTTNFDDVIFDMSDSILKGFVCLENKWTRYGKTYLLESIKFRHQRFFTTGIGYDRDSIRLRKDGMPYGEELWKYGWICHIHKTKSGYVVRNGLVRPLSWPFLFKNLAIADLSEFLDRFGIPLVLGKYASASTEEQRNALFNAVEALSKSGRGTLPQGMDIDIISAQQGQSSPFSSMIDWAESTMSKCLLGGTLTSSQGKVGSQALGTVHETAMWDIVRSDAIQIQETLTRQLVLPLAELNYSITDPRRTPRFVFNTVWPEDMEKVSRSLEGLVRVGVQIPRDWPNGQLQIPVPSEGEPVLNIKGVYTSAQTQVAEVVTAGDQPTVTATAPLAAFSEAPPDSSDSQLDVAALWLSSRYSDVIGARIDQALSVIENAENLESARAAITELAKTAPPQAMINAIARASANSALLGSMQYQLDNQDNEWSANNDVFASDADVGYWESQGYQSTDATSEMLLDDAAAALIIAKLLDIELMKSVRAAIDGGIALALPVSQMRGQVEKSLQISGWTGNNPYRLTNVYRQTLQQSYQFGGWSRIQQQARVAPILRYTAVLDERTRPEHRRWHGTTLPANHPWWATHYPPNGFNCRCRVVQMSLSGMAANGYSITPENTIDYDVSKIDEGFRYNVGMYRKMYLDNLYNERIQSFLSS